LKSFRSIGHLIPLFITLAGVADVGTRFLPLAWFSMRLEEPSTRYPIGMTDLTPNFHYDMPRSYGDLANLVNSPRYRFYHRQWMNVNGDGFRLDGAPAMPGKPPEALLFGDSFARGVSLSDDATLAAQFSRIPGRSLFDSSLRLDWGRTRRALDYLGMTKGTVVVALVDRLALPGVEEFQDRPQRNTAWRRFNHQCQKLWDGFWEVCPLQIFSERLIRRLQNDTILPNPHASWAKVETLVNGQPMLFFDQDIAASEGGMVGTIDGLLLYQDHLRRRGIDLLILVVPNKYLVYRQLIQHAPRQSHGPSRASRYEDALHQAGIRVLNLEHVFIPEAEAALQRGELLYWPDDTHWNSNGTRLAAQALAQALR